MSSHREAPEISKDPVADSTDLYAFVSPDRPDTVTLIANYVPLQSPAGGPNFYEFGNGVLYEIHIDNDGDGRADITYQFDFTTELQVGGTFLYNVGPIMSLDSPIVEPASVLRRDAHRLEGPRRRVRRRARLAHTESDGFGFGFDPKVTTLLDHASCPPCNIGPLSTPDYVVARQRRGSQSAGRRQSCSPVSAPRASTSISARCSTSAICGRSSSCTRTSGSTCPSSRNRRRA